jgi:hypothetical protein
MQAWGHKRIPTPRSDFVKKKKSKKQHLNLKDHLKSYIKSSMT